MKPHGLLILGIGLVSTGVIYQELLEVHFRENVGLNLLIPEKAA